jgi:hypothetical protein
MKKRRGEERQQVNKRGLRVVGKRRSLLEQGVRIMTCIAIKPKLRTRFDMKDYLYWKDENTGDVLEQFFNHPKERYPIRHKAVESYMVALKKKFDDVKRVDLSEIVGLRAKVTVEVVRPKYAKGPLKGKTKPEIFHYSKVGDIVEPIDWDKTIQKTRSDSDD